MAEPTILDNIREWIGGIAFNIFLMCKKMTKDEYHILYKLSVMRELPQACPHGYNGLCAICDATQTPSEQ